MKLMYIATLIHSIHLGHLDFLEKAKAEGDFVIVGLHTDPVSNLLSILNYMTAS